MAATDNKGDPGKILNDFREAQVILYASEEMFSGLVSSGRKNVRSMHTYLDNLPMLIEELVSYSKPTGGQSDETEDFVNSRPFKSCSKAMNDYARFINDAEKTVIRTMLGYLKSSRFKAGLPAMRKLQLSKIAGSKEAFVSCVDAFPSNPDSIEKLHWLAADYRVAATNTSEQYATAYSLFEQRSEELLVPFSKYNARARQFYEKFADLSSAASKVGLIMKTFPELKEKYRPFNLTRTPKP